MLGETGMKLEKLTDDDIVNMKEMDSDTNVTIMRFYTLLVREPCQLLFHDANFSH